MLQIIKVLMDGKKTYLSGVILISWGAYCLFSGHGSQDEAIKSIAEGLGLIGIGHKLDKSASQ